MKMRLSLFILVFLMNSGLVSAAVDVHETREPTALEKKTFTRLKKKFPGGILDENLETLHALAESTEYKHFLAEAYAEAAVPPEFAEVINAEGPLVDDTLYRIRPPKKRYLPYYTEHFGVQTPDAVTDTEHFIVHHEVTGYWITTAIKQGGDTPAYLRTKGPRLSGVAKGKLFQTQQLKEMMKHRFGIEIQEKMDFQTTLQMMPVYEMPIAGIAFVLRASDARWIQAMFEKHGTAEGLIWIALQDPALFSRIRYAFTREKHFLHFVDTAPKAFEAQQRSREAVQRMQQLKRKQTHSSAPD